MSRRTSKSKAVRSAGRLSHLDSRGEATMVDVSAKPVLMREAVACGEIFLQRSTLRLIQRQAVAKGNVFATARLAGILAAKRTGELIPLCHPLPITFVEVHFAVPAQRNRIRITARAKIAAGPGVEMEALTAVAIAALTIYDMCKAVDKKMRISGIRLMSKTKTPVNSGRPRSKLDSLGAEPRLEPDDEPFPTRRVARE